MKSSSPQYCFASLKLTIILPKARTDIEQVQKEKKPFTLR
jgi:hypothetical protein